MSNIQFTIHFNDKSGNPVNQYDKTDILALTDFQNLENASNQAYPNQCIFVNDGITTAPPTISVNAEAEYVDDVCALINNTAIPNPTTTSGTLNGQVINTPIEFTIVLPNGQSKDGVILSAQDYISLQNNVAAFAIENITPTTATPNTTYSALASWISSGSSTAPTASQINQQFILASFTIESSDGNGVYRCQLVYATGEVDTYDLSTANVQYWLKNSAQITDQTGVFVGNNAPVSTVPVAVTTTPPSAVPATPTGTTTTPSTDTALNTANNTITQLNSQIATLQTQNSSNQSAQTQLQNEITALEAQVASLTAGNNTDQSTYSATQQALLDANNKLQTLQSEYATNQQNLNTVLAQLANANTTASGLQSGQNATENASGDNKIAIVATIVGAGLIATGIWFLDPKKKTVGEIVTKKIKDIAKPVAEPILKVGEKIVDMVYCKKCHRKKKLDHNHFKESK